VKGSLFELMVNLFKSVELFQRARGRQGRARRLCVVTGVYQSPVLLYIRPLVRLHVHSLHRTPYEIRRQLNVDRHLGYH
jgi:hypothetical protein